METGDITVYMYMHVKSNLTFVAWAQNYIKWAEFSTNHSLSIG